MHYLEFEHSSAGLICLSAVTVTPHKICKALYDVIEVTTAIPLDSNIASEVLSGNGRALLGPGEQHRPHRLGSALRVEKLPWIFGMLLNCQRDSVVNRFTIRSLPRNHAGLMPFTKLEQGPKLKHKFSRQADGTG